jgi:hypothetical protein
LNDDRMICQMLTIIAGIRGDDALCLFDRLCP